jgi:hypothetical protein
MAMWPMCCTPLAQSSRHACGAGRAPSSAPQRLSEIKGESGLAAIAAGALVVAALWVVQSVVVCAAI